MQFLNRVKNKKAKQQTIPKSISVFVKLAKIDLI